MGDYWEEPEQCVDCGGYFLPDEDDEDDDNGEHLPVCADCKV